MEKLLKWLKRKQEYQLFKLNLSQRIPYFKLNKYNDVVPKSSKPVREYADFLKNLYKQGKETKKLSKEELDLLLKLKTKYRGHVSRIIMNVRKDSPGIYQHLLNIKPEYHSRKYSAKKWNKVIKRLKGNFYD